MIPRLNEHGVLPPGIHDCTLLEIQDRYVTIPRRQKLWSGFQKYFELIKPLGFFPTIFFGGSFVTNRRSPRDIDIVLEVTKDYALARSLDERSAWMFDKQQTAQYWIDAGEWLPGVPPDQDLLLNLQRVDESEALTRGMRKDDRKGVLRVTLWNSLLTK